MTGTEQDTSTISGVRSQGVPCVGAHGGRR